ncbi:sugar ABC transporter ATP-binding protein [Mammaliicoccus sciuri]|uniref:Ribose/galactose/methyl galactoside import ATP-binding protein n=2 Tax=Sporosarcina newyorkensis TaxID=759851 RepID=A0A1T4Y806_9BACL|nr:monosaccharide ABC transporter ATP-binding protein, CUT2 family (TC 3.A.1.2.-) [Sporosarcina newyorkensis]
MKLEMEKIFIGFPGVKALKGVDFAMKSGSIHALIGANGAGKSTLMKVLSGAYDHYEGEILLDGKAVEIRNPKQAKMLGIDIVFQEVDTALIPYLTVGENIMLDSLANDMGGKHFVNWKQTHKRAKEVLEELHINLPTRRLVSRLTLAEKQMVLIARSLVQKPKFLILDEPTAPLSTAETKELFRVIRNLCSMHGVGIIFISHRLPELFEICEDITVMKDGEFVSCRPIKSTSIKEVVDDMLGGNMVDDYVKKKSVIGEEVLSIRNLTDKEGTLDNASFSVKSGEIVGIAGLVGAGKTELCKTIFGDNTIDSGEIMVNGKLVKPSSPYHAVKEGFALVPEERRKEGVLVEEPVFSNLSAPSLHNFTSLGFLNTKKEKVAAVKMIKDLGIKTPSENQKVALLSGGNQQKVAVGKWLQSNAHVYMFDEPTKGVDVGAKSEIFQLIEGLAERGKAILYASSEIVEILAITDRVYIMYDNRIVKEVVTSETNEEEIMYYSTGGE